MNICRPVYLGLCQGDMTSFYTFKIDSFTHLYLVTSFFARK